MKIGLALPHYDFSFPDGAGVTVARTIGYAARAERLGFDSVWVSDHLFLDIGKYGGSPQPARSLEAFTALASVAAATERTRLGTLVACLALRPAATLALAASTLREASGGRFELGVGAGWYEPEFRAVGAPFGTARERFDALEEGLRILRRSWDERGGEAPRLWIGGGGGPRLMRLVAETADGWNVVWQMTPAAYRERLETLRAACDRAGRDPEGVALSLGLHTLVGTGASDVERRYERYRARTPGVIDDVPLETFAKTRLVGAPDECARKIKEYEALGVEELILSCAPLPFSIADDEQLELVASELLPLVR